MGQLRRSPRLRDRATELGLSRQGIALIVYGEGRDISRVRFRLRNLVRILRELGKLGPAESQRAWLLAEDSPGWTPPLVVLRTVKGLTSVEDQVFCMTDMMAGAEDMFPYDPYPGYSLWHALIEQPDEAQSHPNLDRNVAAPSRDFEGVLQAAHCAGIDAAESCVPEPMSAHGVTYAEGEYGKAYFAFDGRSSLGRWLRRRFFLMKSEFWGKYQTLSAERNTAYLTAVRQALVQHGLVAGPVKCNLLGEY